MHIPSSIVLSAVGARPSRLPPAPSRHTLRIRGPASETTYRDPTKAIVDACDLADHTSGDLAVLRSRGRIILVWTSDLGSDNAFLTLTQSAHHVRSEGAEVLAIVSPNGRIRASKELEGQARARLHERATLQRGITEITRMSATVKAPARALAPPIDDARAFALYGRLHTTLKQHIRERLDAREAALRAFLGAPASFAHFQQTLSVQRSQACSPEQRDALAQRLGEVGIRNVHIPALLDAVGPSTTAKHAFEEARALLGAIAKLRTHIDAPLAPTLAERTEDYLRDSDATLMTSALSDAERSRLIADRAQRSPQESAAGWLVSHLQVAHEALIAALAPIDARLAADVGLEGSHALYRQLGIEASRAHARDLAAEQARVEGWVGPACAFLDQRLLASIETAEEESDAEMAHVALTAALLSFGVSGDAALYARVLLGARGEVDTETPPDLGNVRLPSARLPMLTRAAVFERVRAQVRDAIEQRERMLREAAAPFSGAPSEQSERFFTLLAEHPEYTPALSGEALRLFSRDRERYARLAAQRGLLDSGALIATTAGAAVLSRGLSFAASEDLGIATAAAAQNAARTSFRVSAGLGALLSAHGISEANEKLARAKAARFLASTFGAEDRATLERNEEYFAALLNFVGMGAEAKLSFGVLRRFVSRLEAIHRVSASADRRKALVLRALEELGVSMLSGGAQGGLKYLDRWNQPGFLGIVAEGTITGGAAAGFGHGVGAVLSLGLRAVPGARITLEVGGREQSVTVVSLEENRLTVRGAQGETSLEITRAVEVRAPEADERARVDAEVIALLKTSVPPEHATILELLLDQGGPIDDLAGPLTTLRALLPRKGAELDALTRLAKTMPAELILSCVQCRDREAAFVVERFVNAFARGDDLATLTETFALALRTLSEGSQDVGADRGAKALLQWGLERGLPLPEGVITAPLPASAKRLFAKLHWRLGEAEKRALEPEIKAVVAETSDWAALQELCALCDLLGLTFPLYEATQAAIVREDGIASPSPEDLALKASWLSARSGRKASAAARINAIYHRAIAEQASSDPRLQALARQAITPIDGGQAVDSEATIKAFLAIAGHTADAKTSEHDVIRAAFRLRLLLSLRTLTGTKKAPSIGMPEDAPAGDKALMATLLAAYLDRGAAIDELTALAEHAYFSSKGANREGLFASEQGFWRAILPELADAGIFQHSARDARGAKLAASEIRDLRTVLGDGDFERLYGLVFRDGVFDLAAHHPLAHVLDRWLLVRAAKRAGIDAREVSRLLVRYGRSVWDRLLDAGYEAVDDLRAPFMRGYAIDAILGLHHRHTLPLSDPPLPSARLARKQIRLVEVRNRRLAELLALRPSLERSNADLLMRKLESLFAAYRVNAVDYRTFEARARQQVMEHLRVPNEEASKLVIALFASRAPKRSPLSDAVFYLSQRSALSEEQIGARTLEIHDAILRGDEAHVFALVRARMLAQMPSLSGLSEAQWRALERRPSLALHFSAEDLLAASPTDIAAMD